MARLALLWLCGLLSPALAAEGLRVSLHPHVDVAASIATLADVAELAGDPALVKAAAAVTVAELPGLGARVIDPPAVRTAIGRLMPAGALSISGECQLSRRARTIGADDLVAAAAALAKAGGGEVEVATVRTSGAMLVPDDAQPPRIVAEALDRALSGEIPYRVRALRGDAELARGLVVLKVDRFQTAMVAARSIHRGEALGVGDLRGERITLGRGVTGAPVAADEVVGQLARADIAAGTPLSAALVQPRSDVHGGQAIVLVFGREGFQVTAAGEALADGRIGEVIPVRRGADGKTVKAQVSGPGEAQVNY
jgi:flagella basal body P-ring formation protein FlgA